MLTSHELFCVRNSHLKIRSVNFSRFITVTARYLFILRTFDLGSTHTMGNLVGKNVGKNTKTHIEFKNRINNRLIYFRLRGHH